MVVAVRASAGNLRFASRRRTTEESNTGSHRRTRAWYALAVGRCARRLSFLYAVWSRTARTVCGGWGLISAGGRDRSTSGLEPDEFDLDLPGVDRTFSLDPFPDDPPPAKTPAWPFPFPTWSPPSEPPSSNRNKNEASANASFNRDPQGPSATLQFAILNLQQ